MGLRWLIALAGRIYPVFSFGNLVGLDDLRMKEREERAWSSRQGTLADLNRLLASDVGILLGMCGHVFCTDTRRGGIGGLGERFGAGLGRGWFLLNLVESERASYVWFCTTTTIASDTTWSAAYDVRFVESLSGVRGDGSCFVGYIDGAWAGRSRTRELAS